MLGGDIGRPIEDQSIRPDQIEKRSMGNKKKLNIYTKITYTMTKIKRIGKPVIINNKKLLNRMNVNRKKYKLVRVRGDARCMVLVNPPTALVMMINGFINDER